jgi:hypothetical protein
LLNNGEKMKNLSFLPFVLLSVLIITACDGINTGDLKYFDRDLRETWTSDENQMYYGEIEITSDTIKITGYNETQTPLEGDDSKRPFRDITVKKVALDGYSEDGRIYIDGFVPEGIPYVLRTYKNSYPYTKVLEFTFGGRPEILYVKETE